MDATQIDTLDVEKIERLTQIAAREGMATFISVVFVCIMVPFLWFFLYRIYKKLVEVEKNTKGYVSDEVLKDILNIFISDIRNKEQSYIYNKIEKNHLTEYYEGYIENDILNEAMGQVNEKREALVNLTTYNNVNQFRSVTEKNLSWHIGKIKKVFSEELAKESIDYENLKSVTNREMEQFEQETINQLNKIF